jgi:hypothetical protein
MECYKTPPVGGYKCSSCGTLSEGAEVESEGEMKAVVDDAMEDGIDVAVVVNVGDGAVFVSGPRADICTGAGVCASEGVIVGVFILGFQVGCSSCGVQVCAFKLGCPGRGVL